MAQQRDTPTTPADVQALVDEQGIRFIRLWFTDILGQLKSFSINAAELTDAFEGGMGFDGSSITGFNAMVNVAGEVPVDGSVEASRIQHAA